MEKLDTGDLLLFHSNSAVGCCLQCVTKSKYCHIGMVLKNPTFINENLKGYYLWESGREPFKDSEDKELFYGVQIVPLEKVLEEYNSGEVFYRKLFLVEQLNKAELKKVHQEIHHHKYDLNVIDWLRAGIYQVENNLSDSDKLLKKEKIKIPNSVWCSALIGYIFFRMEWMSSDIRWKFLSPEDWSYPNEKELKLLDCFLTPDNKLF